MTKIKDTERQAVQKQIDNVVTMTGYGDFSFPAERVTNMFLTKTQQAIINDAVEIVGKSAFNNISKIFRRVVTVNHPVYPDVFEAEIGFNVSSPRDRFIWPKDTATAALLPTEEAHQANSDFVEVMGRLCWDAIDRALFRSVSEWLLRTAHHHEQIRYMFPPYLMMLRKAGLGDIANSIEEVKRPPVPLNHIMPFLMRQQIRHVLTWFAGHQLMETFDGASPARVRYEDLYVTLCGNMTFARGSDSYRYVVKMEC